ncbi:cobalt-precorrin 5A hydrolase [Methanomicrobium sp. W14]|jgi:cobalt-precorrin 5A hydrolase|uniref:cobalt-precorrin 5A hydrolase n=1 Tax=Methanomicrobium sp. W14 TaxID=2817839 RepID=UPI001AE9F570|nr:cobalt-precorrin 5A hydrolase [Methanomicrobium sp. W14]MBP2132753.1 cobalt-precorrin 5A hydrolase [Methanomicrobium sp. W14]
MKETVVISLKQFSEDSKNLAGSINADYLPYKKEVFIEAFGKYKKIVAVMSAGIAVRGISGLLKDKWTDPCVVVVSPDLKFAVPILGGHHGGNELAKEMSELGIIPVITTATETRGLMSVESVAENIGRQVLNKDSTREVNAAVLKGTIPKYVLTGPAIALVEPSVSVLLRKGEYIAGVGCRRGVTESEVLEALNRAFEISGVKQDEIFAYTTTKLKEDEKGLISAIGKTGGTLVFLDDDIINAEKPESPSRASDKIGLNSVAESAALALSKRKEIVMKKHIFGRVTVAIVR